VTLHKLEYLWLDGYQPVANLRSKTKILDLDSYTGELDRLPEWNFDGSSTLQADGGDSEVVLKPVRVYPDPGRKNGWLVVAETFKPDGTPHPTNTRGLTDAEAIKDYWFGFEQEYVLMNDSGRPIGFPGGGYPEPQGPYYCAVGYQYVAGRDIIEEHLEECLDAGLGITGVNAEVMLGASERHRVQVELHPKPLAGDWNGSGMHANFSYPHLRDVGGEEYIKKLLDGFGERHEAHVAEYGAHNEMRLTGRHETASIQEFSYGVANRGASVRIPIFTVQDGWKGYLEDRRPASNADPYRVIARITRTVEEVHAEIL
jgi:glutamine synthetase